MTDPYNLPDDLTAEAFLNSLDAVDAAAAHDGTARLTDQALVELTSKALGQLETTGEWDLPVCAFAVSPAGAELRRRGLSAAQYAAAAGLTGAAARAAEAAVDQTGAGAQAFITRMDAQFDDPADLEGWAPPAHACAAGAIVEVWLDALGSERLGDDLAELLALPPRDEGAPDIEARLIVTVSRDGREVLGMSVRGAPGRFVHVCAPGDAAGHGARARLVALVRRLTVEERVRVRGSLGVCASATWAQAAAVWARMLTSAHPGARPQRNAAAHTLLRPDLLAVALTLPELRDARPSTDSPMFTSWAAQAEQAFLALADEGPLGEVLRTYLGLLDQEPAGQHPAGWAEQLEMALDLFTPPVPPDIIEEFTVAADRWGLSPVITADSVGALQRLLVDGDAAAG